VDKKLAGHIATVDKKIVEHRDAVDEKIKNKIK